MLMETGSCHVEILILIDSAAYKEYTHLSEGAVSSNHQPCRLSNPEPERREKVLRTCYYDRKKITQEQITAYAAPLSEAGARHALLETGKQLIPPNFEEFVANTKP